LIRLQICIEIVLCWSVSGKGEGPMKMRRAEKDLTLPFLEVA
jgi:hypothetical protein